MRSYLYLSFSIEAICVICLKITTFTSVNILQKSIAIITFKFLIVKFKLHQHDICIQHSGLYFSRSHQQATRSPRQGMFWKFSIVFFFIFLSISPLWGGKFGGPSRLGNGSKRVRLDRTTNTMTAFLEFYLMMLLIWF